MNGPEEIPTFKDEHDEAEFRATHSLGPGMLARMHPGGDPPLDELLPVRRRSITIRLDADVYRRLRTLAGHKGRRHQTLLKEAEAAALQRHQRHQAPAGDLQHGAIAVR